MSQPITAAKKTRLRPLISAPVAGLFCLSLALPSFANTPTVAGPEAIILTPSEAVESPETLADKYALMALFAKTSYRKDITDKKERKKHPCDSITRPLPKHWTRWEKPGAVTCENIGGLYFETYAHTTDQKIDMAVISIRGTEFTSWKDWKANMSGLFRFKRNEYSYAQNTILPLIKLLKAEGVKDIYLTGHSLGGGLAQEIAYLSKDITATYTFNTSPVTYWTRLHDDKPNKNPIIYRVYMTNDALEYIRFVTNLFIHHPTNRIDIKVKAKFPGHANPLIAHSMSHLTCYLAEQVTKNGAQFDYSKDDADAVLAEPALCP